MVYVMWIVMELLQAKQRVKKNAAGAVMEEVEEERGQIDSDVGYWLRYLILQELWSLQESEWEGETRHYQILWWKGKFLVIFIHRLYLQFLEFWIYVFVFFCSLYICLILNSIWCYLRIGLEFYMCGYLFVSPWITNLPKILASLCWV